MSDWKLVCKLEDIPQLGSRVVRRATGGDIAVFRNAEDEVFALHDKCPHKSGPLSQGIVFGEDGSGGVRVALAGAVTDPTALGHAAAEQLLAGAEPLLGGTV